jgi:hypothetical protein
MHFESTRTIQSEACAGVAFTIARMTFGRRVELMRRVRQLGAQLEFANAGQGISDRVEASLVAASIDEAYLRWGLVGLQGLEIDGRVADTDALISSGPEPLCREVVSAIKRECALTEEERKN